MVEKIAHDKTQTEIPYGLIEYTVLFERPVVVKWESGRVAAIDRVLQVLKPWGFTLDGVEIKNREKLNEHSIVFRRTSPVSPPMSISLFLGKIVVSAENLDWGEAEDFIKCITSGLHAIDEIMEFKVRSQHLALAMHVQCKTKPRKEVTAPLLSPLAFGLLDGEVKFQGIILNRDKSTIIIDASVPYANGLFVRMFREHPPEIMLEQMAEHLRADEEQLFEVLGLEGAL